MAASNIIPVILSGGSGTRLWPLSRQVRPKQFLNFGAEHSLIQNTLLRCAGPDFDTIPIVVGAHDHRFMLADAAQALNLKPRIVLEPMRRDSCAAIVAGALLAMERRPDAVILVVAADHHIPDGDAFAKAVAQALPAAQHGMLVTFGVKPVSPSTGYGYILPGQTTKYGHVAQVARFVEKPDVETAKGYVTSGYLWNSGNFLFAARSFIAEARLFAPLVVDAMEKALAQAEKDRDFIRLNDAAFAASPQISIDYAVMEKTSKACVLPVDYAWSDIGSWDAVAASLPTDESQNAVVGEGVVEASSRVTVHSQGILTAVVGCSDLVVVTTPDAVLVAKRGDTERVKRLVDRLNSSGQSHRL
jgi:mannose-1-phosphate guanylyltransferase / mannose-6-phosphate isomerase